MVEGEWLKVKGQRSKVKRSKMSKMSKMSKFQIPISKVRFQDKE
jgi:hypothetical protein